MYLFLETNCSFLFVWPHPEYTQKVLQLLAFSSNKEIKTILGGCKLFFVFRMEIQNLLFMQRETKTIFVAFLGAEIYAKYFRRLAII